MTEKKFDIRITTFEVLGIQITCENFKSFR